MDRATRRLGWSLLLACLCLAWPSRAAVAIPPRGDAPVLRSPPIVRGFSIAQGLPQASVSTVLRTRDGFLWVGTFGGLARFDGHEFRVFRSDTDASAPASYRITTLHEDARQRLWVGTEDAGISVYEHGRFRQLWACPGACRVYDLFSGDGNDIWALTSSGGFRFDPTTLMATQRLTAAGRFHRAVQAGGQLLVAGESGLSRLTQGRATPIALPDGHRGVDSVAADGAAVWLVLDQAALYRFDVGNGRWTRIRAALRRDSRVLSDGAGGIYFSDSVGGTRRLASDGTVTPLPGAQRMQAVNLYRTAGNALWIGTPAQGLWLLRPALVDLLRNSENPDQPGRVLAADGVGGMWLVMSCAELWHFDRAGRPLDGPIIVTGEHGGCVHGLLYDAPTTSVLAGTSDGSLLRVAGRRVEPIGHWPNAGLSGIWKQRDGTVWTANQQFVSRLRFDSAGRAVAADPITELAGAQVQDIRDARAGGVWVTADRGVFRVVGNAVVERWTPAQGLVGRNFRALHEDEAGAIWVGSYGHGLFRIGHGQVRRYTEAEGLFDDTVSCILPGGNGWLWLAGNRGIVRVQGRTIDTGGPDMRTLTLTDGLDPPEFNGSAAPTCADDGAGHLWFTMMAGFARVNPARFRNQADADNPTPYIDQATVAQRKLSIASGRVKLDAGARNLQIRFGAIELLEPGKVRFRYRLTDDDKAPGGWVDVDAERSLLLPELPWGSRVFQVQARRIGGAWSAPATLRLDHPRPWYEYRWLWIGLSLFSLLALLWLGRTDDVVDADVDLLAQLRKPDTKA